MGTQILFIFDGYMPEYYQDTRTTSLTALFDLNVIIKTLYEIMISFINIFYT
jgi:hypothetical protein